MRLITRYIVVNFEKNVSRNDLVPLLGFN